RGPLRNPRLCPGGWPPAIFPPPRQMPPAIFPTPRQMPPAIFRHPARFTTATLSTRGGRWRGACYPG
ncbi:MAG: hypothetical protein NC484_05500, partial [Alloprevotella sp.]|nr:hypothetical protein [Alloprevotella sp.]